MTLEMPDFNTATVPEMGLYMMRMNFKIETSPSGYMCLETNADQPGAETEHYRYSDVYEPLQESLERFMARLCTRALWREAEKAGIIDPDLLKWKDHWFIPVPE